ncbi:methyltransferase domain-containing protein [Spirosoma jeollabukense]
MLSLSKQLESGSLVCPRTHVPLKKVNNHLETIDGKVSYSLVGEVPILFPDILTQEAYLRENGGEMNEEYKGIDSKKNFNFFKKLLAKDFKSKGANESFREIFDNQSDTALCIAIGGGPLRHHPKLTNLNIGGFKNVDVVADAYSLPYANNSVDAVYIEAVLEHLEFPEHAVKEIFRVLKKGGKVYADTPFMQGFHGYPNHFQNFTIEGHKRLFSRNGFTVIQSGTSVGPTFVLFSFLKQYIQKYIYPSIFKYPLLVIAAGASLVFKPIDLLLNDKEKSHFLASSTFLHAVK